MKRTSPAETERRAGRALRAFLADIPRLEVEQVAAVGMAGQPDQGVDIIADADLGGKPLRLLVQVKSNGQPRIVRETAHQLRRYLAQHDGEGVPMFIAPFLSEQARAVCREEGMAYLDFEGNAHIAFETIFIDRHVAGRPEPERRELRSLFKPKSARILRVLVDDPTRAWRVTDLAKAAKVSVGLVSTIGSALREREWLRKIEDGLQLDDPDGLLDAWAQGYEPPKGEERRFYTHLHGKALTDRLSALDPEHGRIALASFSAADWYAPFVRQATTQLYADADGAEELARRLDLTTPAKGANLIVRIPDEDGVLDDARAVAPGLLATSPVQTYLDLQRAGERGGEGARHLREHMLRWEG